MADQLNEIPERIEQGEQQFLNCKIGSDTKPNSDADALVLTCLENALSNSFYRYITNILISAGIAVMIIWI